MIFFGSLTLGFASQEDLRNYAIKQTTDPRIANFGLPQLTGEPRVVVRVGRLINRKSTLFISPSGQYYSVTLAKPLSGNEGQEVYVFGEGNIVAGDSIVSLKNGTHSSSSWGGEFASPQHAEYKVFQSRVAAMFPLRDTDQAQEMAALLRR